MEWALDGDPPCTRSSYEGGRTASPLFLRWVEATVVVDGGGSGRDSTHRRLEEHQRDQRNTLVALDSTGEGRRRLATEGILQRSNSPELRETSSRLLLGGSRANPEVEERVGARRGSGAP